MSTLRERFEQRMKEAGYDPRNPPRPWYFTTAERWLRKGPRFYYGTLPLGAAVFGVLWYLPYERERQQEKGKSLIELWRPWVAKTIEDLKNGM